MRCEPEHIVRHAVLAMAFLVLTVADAIVGNGLDAIAWAVVGAACATCAIVTMPRCRSKFCVWLSGLGRGGRAKTEAIDAALLVWVTIGDVPPSKGTGTEMAGGA